MGKFDQNSVKDRAALQPLPGRLACLDALRGFDMFWIIGGDTLLHVTAGMTGYGLLSILSDQMRHAEWAGLNAYDLIFPLFMFLSGVSLSLSLRARELGSPGKRCKFMAKTTRRTLILILLGVVYNFGWDVSPERFRLASVLGQIGIAYFLTALVFVYEPRNVGRTLALGFVMLTTAVLQQFIHVPGGGAGMLTPDGSMNAWIDQAFLPGRLYGGSYDPEGILNSFSASAVTMMGALAGGFIEPAAPRKTLKYLSLTGVFLLLAGYAVSTGYPIIKAAWTVPFSLITAGISALLLALFFWLFDVLKLKGLALFLCVIGINSIGIYLAARFFAYPVLALAADETILSPLSAVFIVLGVIAVEWLALYFCFRKGWFLKV